MQARRYITRFANGDSRVCEALSFADAALAATEFCPLSGDGVTIEISDAETGETEWLTLDIAARAPARRRLRRVAA